MGQFRQFDDLRNTNRMAFNIAYCKVMGSKANGRIFTFSLLKPTKGDLGVLINFKITLRKNVK